MLKTNVIHVKRHLRLLTIFKKHINHKCLIYLFNTLRSTMKLFTKMKFLTTIKFSQQSNSDVFFSPSKSILHNTDELRNYRRGEIINSL